MPYIGVDPTGPGHNWVKTGNGWKIIEVRDQVNRKIKKFARNRISAYKKLEKHDRHAVEPSTSSNHEQSLPMNQPASSGDSTDFLFLPTAWRSSRQRGTFLTVGDVLNRLDLRTALRDHQKFSYVCKIVELVCENHFGSLSGSSIKILFSVLEEFVDIVEETNQHNKRVISLLGTVKDKMKLYSGRLSGSRMIYSCRSHLLNLWLKRLQEIEIPERGDDGMMEILDLPLECLERLFLSLSDPRDIIHLGQTCHELNAISSSAVLWGQLFEYHFTEDQLSAVPEVDGYPDWKAGFKNLGKKAELRVEYPVMLELCCHCSCIYWQGGNHPCSNNTLKEKEKPDDHSTKEIITLPLDPIDFMKMTIVL